MIVRMVSGAHAGAIRNLSFLAARGAIRNGLAEELGKPKPTTEPVTPAAVTTREGASLWREGKRHGKRR